jgi:DNA-binding response OmpR family regulator
MSLSRLLIVEDEKPIAAMYQFKLEKHGYKVDLAESGEAGLRLAEEFTPDLILLDLRMPGMSGSEMLEKLRESQWGSHIRVIILTNISKAEAPAVLRLLNVDRYVVKAHCTPSQLVEIVKETLGEPAQAV